MVYKARRDEAGAVVVDWFVADSLDDLSGKIADGWCTSEAKAREAVPDAPVAVAEVFEAAPEVEEPLPATEAPEPEPKRKSAKKK
jgi:hypothetical protein